MENYFHEILTLECRRTERSLRPFFLMLLNLQNLIPNAGGDDIAGKVAKALFSSTRDTDIKGWYEYNTIIGVLFTGTDFNFMELVRKKIKDSLFASCGREQADKIRISFHVFPDDAIGPGSIWDGIGPGLPKSGESKKVRRYFKRAMDIAGGLLGLIIFLPFFLFIPLLIKLTSKGPVFFRQERIGLKGKPFIFLKFRSMRIDSCDAIHREYVKDFIRGEGDCGEGKKQSRMTYKIKADPRVTAIGRYLRKSSLDELPQFINVLRGEMSLVGPRPPIPYEVKEYDIWHMKRIRDVKPGITGLWQVTGRSSTTFEEMVRLDLRYASTWSLWMDIVILLRTPLAVLTGKGAY